MKLSTKQLLSLEPLRDSVEQPIETLDEYTGRVQELLPNFPCEVISQWFREHQGVIEMHAGLDYQRLSFKKSEFTQSELMLPCLAKHDTVIQYRDYFVGGVESPRMNRLAKYIKENGTWPVAPLIFDNPDGRFVSSWGLKYSQPYDLLEGHHRMAVLYALGAHEEGRHAVWLVQKV